MLILIILYFSKKKLSIEDETAFCDPEILKLILKSKVCKCFLGIFYVCHTDVFGTSFVYHSCAMNIDAFRRFV